MLTCLSLFCALQRSVSSDEAVSLNCNNTVSVTAGENVTLNCSITSTFGGKVCTGQKYDWHNTNGNKLCETNATKYTCAWDALTYVSLTISNVQEEANVTAEIVSICGMVKSLPVRVQLIIDPKTDVFQPTTPPDNGPRTERSGQREESTRETTIVLCVFASAVVVFILYFLYRTYRRRVRERTVTYTAPVSKDFTVV